LLHAVFEDVDEGMDTRARCVPSSGRRIARGPDLVVLAEFLAPWWGDEEEWPELFHRAYRLLRGGGLLAVAARPQEHEAGGVGLVDRCGGLVASARTAGFLYLQHIIAVNGSLAGDRLVPDPRAAGDGPPGGPSGVVHRRVHTDLLVFRAPEVSW
jgi:hypothetical protein